MMLRDLRYGVEPDDGENLRRIGRSLSGTVVTPRRSRLTATRSFVSVTSCPLPPPCGRAAKLHLPDDSRRGTWHIASPCALLPPPSSLHCLSRFFLLSCFFFYLQSVPLSLSLSSSSLLPLCLSKVKQADVSASPCLLPLFWVPVAIPPLSSPPSPHHQHLLITTSLHRFTGKHCAELIRPHTCKYLKENATRFLGWATLGARRVGFRADFQIRSQKQCRCLFVMFYECLVICFTFWQTTLIWHKSRLRPYLHVAVSWGCALIYNNWRARGFSHPWENLPCVKFSSKLLQTSKNFRNQTTIQLIKRMFFSLS